MTDYELILSEMELRKIEYFVHFTAERSLGSILKNGILPVATLRKKKIPFYYNDAKRIDTREDAISLSVSFPNHEVFYRFRKAYPKQNWVVLLLDAKGIVCKDVAFYPHNAANKVCASTPWEFNKGYENFTNMFRYPGRDPNISDAYTTDVQAEVMVRGEIEPELIRKIVFEDYWNSEMYKQIYPQIRSKFVADATYFDRRKGGI